MENILINKNRIEWVDIAKGIGIFLMVMGHTGIPKIGIQWIYSFHMPLFFLLVVFCFNQINIRYTNLYREKLGL